MPRVAIIVPWRGGCPYRERAWAWLQARYAAEHPDWELIEAPGPDPWVKARAVMPAVAACSADVLVIADADVWTDGLPAAVEQVAAGAPWAIPHYTLRRLTEHGTAAALAGAPLWDQPLAEHAYPGVQGGGIVVTHRAIAEAVPLDARFVGWGQEDQSWAIALHFTVGPAWRGNTPLYHLWHPPQQRMDRRYGSDASRQLWRRYVRARGDDAAMQDLVREARDALTAHQ